TRDEEETFTTPGVYKVLLIATNKAKGCADTASATITVRYVNAAFTFNASYISNSACPPVLVQFNSTSSNATRITWDLGDGTVLHNHWNPSHVYTKPGRYRVTVRTYSDNGTEYTTVDSLDIKAGPEAKLQASTLQSCTAQTVTLRAAVKGGLPAHWDFGDGTVRPLTDTFAVHTYARAGNYTPRLLLQDDEGCPASVTLERKVVIDSLAVRLAALPATICAPRQLSFAADVQHTGAGQPGQELSYHWDFGTGKAGDTSALVAPAFTYPQPGNYTIRLTVRSSAGCVRKVQHAVTAFQGLGGRIDGPAEICQDGTARFTGATQLPGSPEWTWVFADGTTFKGRETPVKTYSEAGAFPLTLVVDNKGCVDSIPALLTVHPKPQVTLPAAAHLCLGSRLPLTATGADRYSWSPAVGLSAASGATVTASPTVSTEYTVLGTSAFGCTHSASVRVNVVAPQAVQVTGDTSLCAGSSVTLRASGATAYRWIGSTAGLSGTAGPDPVARPAATTLYQVVGTDAHQCFFDTASVRVVVHPLPVVDAGPGAELFSGEPYLMKPTGSTDIIQWNWSPATYLSCTGCIAPEVKPAESTTYRLTVKNAAGCEASDTLSVKLLCGENRVHIPNAISPNGDGKNDLFYISAQGIRKVHHLRIYNRWGELVFRKADFIPGDRSAAWDGKHKGMPLPAGSYVYIAELSCNETKFSVKGTVTLVY
ncbi:MAG TPA: PKD domain-containing protein, partial [Chitinophagaceae bacterium]|nr:PKD domain-containing protein [Chitinophagaceae bacterium]